MNASQRKHRPTKPAPGEPVRIAKALARAGLCSRREAERWIAQGRVSVNGEVLASPARDVSARDRILVDGNELPAAEPPRVFTKVTMRFVVTGRGLSRTAVERAVELSAEKYCSASIMLAKTAEMVREIELREAAAT